MSAPDPHFHLLVESFNGDVAAAVGWMRSYVGGDPATASEAVAWIGEAGVRPGFPLPSDDYRVECRVLTWSKEPPTAEGYYWFRSPASEPTLARVTKDVTGGETTWDVEFLEDGEIEPLEPGLGDEWAGPLVPPA